MYYRMVREYDFSRSLSCWRSNCRKVSLPPDVKICISSRFTARSSCRNRGPCWSARPPSLRCALRFGLLFSRFSVPPSLRGLSSHHPISCRRVLPAPKGLRLPSSYLLGLPPFGSSFRRAVAAPCSPSPRVVKIVCQMAKKLSICFLPNGKLFLSTKKPPLFHRGGAGC